MECRADTTAETVQKASSTINCTFRFRGANVARRIASTDRKAMFAPSMAA